MSKSESDTVFVQYIKLAEANMKVVNYVVMHEPTVGLPYMCVITGMI